MLTAAVDTAEGLFVEKTSKVVSCRHLLHYFHGQLVGVHGDISGCEDRRKFVLGRGSFVVLGLGQNAVFPKRFVKVNHKLGYPRFQRAEVVVVHLLPLGRACAKEGATRQHEVLSRLIHGFVYEEIFLFGSHRGVDLGRLDMEEF